MKTKYSVPAVEKAMRVVEYMSGVGRAVTQAEVCRAVGMTVTTGYRIMQSLQGRNWVRCVGSGQYVLSTGLVSVLLRAQESGGMLLGVQPYLEELARETHLTCKLSLRHGTEQVTYLRGESPEEFGFTGIRGARFPVVEGSVGAALLVDASEEELEELLKAAPTELEEAQEPELLRARIREVKERGWVINMRAGRGVGVALSMPLRDGAGAVIAAVTLLGHATDFSPDLLPVRVEALTQTLTRIRATL